MNADISRKKTICVADQAGARGAAHPERGSGMADPGY